MLEKETLYIYEPCVRCQGKGVISKKVKDKTYKEVCPVCMANGVGKYRGVIKLKTDEKGIVRGTIKFYPGYKEELK